MLNAFVLLSAAVFASDLPVNPLVLSWERQDYRAESGNWAVTQDAAGFMYFGNNDGILLFDGLRFRLIPLPNGSAVRALLHHQDTVYVGGQAEFGYLATDTDGYAQYVSLSDGLPPEQQHFTDIWSIHALGDHVLFQAQFAAFHYDGSELVTTQADLGRGPLALVSGHGLRFDDAALLKIALDGNFETIATEDAWLEQRLIGAFPQADEHWLLFTVSAGPWRVTGHSVEPHEQADHAIFKEYDLYTAVVTTDGYYWLLPPGHFPGRRHRARP